MAVLRVLLTRRWLGALLASAVFAVACYNLGWWQWHRYQAKLTRNALLDAHYAATPVPLSRVLPGPAALPASAEWTKVSMAGTYADVPQLFVRNRVLGNGVGYEILAAFRTDDGRTVSVDRGFALLDSHGAAVLPPVPPAPTGDVTVVGWLRRGEVDLHRGLPRGQLASISLPEASKAWGMPVIGAYVLLASETFGDGGHPPRPVALGVPDRDLGPHQAYAYQWWMFMAAGFVLVWFGIRRELAQADPQRPAKPKKVRLWDEEDE